MEMHDIVFAFAVASEAAARRAALLVESIRDRAGTFADRAVWAFVAMTPDEQGRDHYPLDHEVESRLLDLDVKLVHFELTAEQARFPFCAKVIASAEAEARALGETRQLLWTDPSSIVLNEPGSLMLKRDKLLGYRPVDLALIGSRYDRPLNSFWQVIYEECCVPAGAVFPMETSVDEVTVRPYFNADMLAVRPETGLLRLWRDNFLHLYRTDRLAPFYDRDNLYRIFVHQTVLAGSVLALLDPEKLQLLPHNRELPPAPA